MNGSASSFRAILLDYILTTIGIYPVEKDEATDILLDIWAGSDS